jgi:hypothetical protein
MRTYCRLGDVEVLLMALRPMQPQLAAIETVMSPAAVDRSTAETARILGESALSRFKVLQ